MYLAHQPTQTMASFKLFALFCISTLAFAHLAEARVKRQILGGGGLGGILGGGQGGVGGVVGGVEGLLNPLQGIERNLTDVVTSIGALLNGTTTLPPGVSILKKLYMVLVTYNIVIIF